MNACENQLRPEILKTLTAGFAFVLSLFLNALSLVMTNQRLPDRSTTKPLPDIILDNLPYWSAGSSYADAILLYCTFTTYGLILFHRYRWIVFRRIFIIFTILYVLRACAVYVTVLPVASSTLLCSPKFNPFTFGEAFQGASHVFWGIGLTITGGHVYCGDYIFSGHTVTLVTFALFVQEYSPRTTWRWSLIQGIYWLAAGLAIVFILLARGHYTIDILTAYYITTRVFWIYHNLAKRQKDNPISAFINRVWWFSVFDWCEGNVTDRIPHHYSLPIPFVPYYADFEKTPIRIVRTDI